MKKDDTVVLDLQSNGNNNVVTKLEPEKRMPADEFFANIFSTHNQMKKEMKKEKRKRRKHHIRE